MKALIGWVALATVLSACSSEQDELRAWMDEVKANTQPVRSTVSEPKRYEPFRYDDFALVDPFSQAKLQAAFDKVAERSKGGLQPDLNRRREPLESFPLENIRLVGNLANGKQNFALLQVDSLVYQARVGNYAGQNFGVITKVTENQVKLKELVQDASGEWVERESELQLQEGSAK